MNDDEKRLVLSTTYRIRNFENDLHLMPQDDWFDHESDANCPCCPFVDPHNKKELASGRSTSTLWVHKQIKNNKRELC
jgi:hypothetical protein